MADNGSGDSPHHFLTACHSLGAKPIKTKPYTPRCTNGKGHSGQVRVTSELGKGSAFGWRLPKNC
jgi:hypothetical protein